MSFAEGPVGAWLSSSIWRGHEDELAARVGLLEELGFGSLWLGGVPSDLGVVEAVLRATEHIVVATGIVNIWTNPAAELAVSFDRLSSRYPGRVLIGLGVGHKSRLDDQSITYAKPYAAMCGYLDELDRSGLLPQDRRVLAALGPRLISLAGVRTAGAHPFLVTPEHTAKARQVLGPSRALVPEQAVVLIADPAEARAVARARIAKYLTLANYRNSLLSQGFSDADISDGGSDRLIDELVAWGEPEAIFRRIRQHLSAGADHVVVQMFTSVRALPLDEWRQFAGQWRN